MFFYVTHKPFLYFGTGSQYSRPVVALEAALEEAHVAAPVAALVEAPVATPVAAPGAAPPETSVNPQVQFPQTLPPRLH
jgi:hypothetical protein